MAEESPLLRRDDANESDTSRRYGTSERSTQQESAQPYQSLPGIAPFVDISHATFRFLLDQWFSFTLLLLIFIASQVQVSESQQQIKKTLVLYVCVTTIFFVTGCTLDTQALLENFGRWQLHLFCQIQSFLLISAMIFGVVSAAASNHSFMDPGLLVGLLFLGCVPTTISSNVVLTRQAAGNTALTVVQSTLGNFLGPFVCPFLLSMYLSSGAWFTHIIPTEVFGGYSELYKRVFFSLGVSIYVPLLGGQIVRNVFPQVTTRIFVDFKATKISTFALLVIMWQPFDAAFASGAFDDVVWHNIVFLVSISITFYIFWTAVCVALSIPWLERRDVVALAYTIPAKTTSIGVPLAEAVFIGVDPTLSAKFKIPVVIYQGLQVAIGGLFTNKFRQWIERSQKMQESISSDDGTE